MTDKEIVQALRCCADHSCSAKCPAFPAGLDCREEMHKEVLALIERLTAENAALREKVPQWVSVEERRPEPGKRVLYINGKYIIEVEVVGYKVDETGAWLFIGETYNPETNRAYHCDLETERIGKTVFFTHEEAERAMEGRKDG